MKYQIEITESRKKVIEVEADNLSGAITETGKAYADGRITLESCDFVGYGIKEYKGENNVRTQ